MQTFVEVETALNFYVFERKLKSFENISKHNFCVHNFVEMKTL